MNEWTYVVGEWFEAIWSLTLVFLGGVIAYVFGPQIRKWVRAQQQQEKEKHRESIDGLKKFIAEAENKLAKEDQPKQFTLKAVTAMLKFQLAHLRLVRIFVGVVTLVLGLGVCAGVVWLMDAGFETIRAGLLQERHEITLQAARRHVEGVDKNREMLYLRTLGQNEKPEPPGEGHARGGHLQFLEEAVKWREEQRAMRDREQLCRFRSYVAGENNTGEDRQRIWVASYSYRACMLEKGWLVESCNPQEDNCRELTYFETRCTVLVRGWLERGGDPYEVKGCLFPSVQERMSAEGY